MMTENGTKTETKSHSVYYPVYNIIKHGEYHERLRSTAVVSSEVVRQAPSYLCDFSPWENSILPLQVTLWFVFHLDWQLGGRVVSFLFLSCNAPKFTNPNSLLWPSSVRPIINKLAYWCHSARTIPWY